jgi:hypothetical protein
MTVLALGMSSTVVVAPVTAILSLTAVVALGIATWLAPKDEPSGPRQMYVWSVVIIGLFLLTSTPPISNWFSDSLPGWFRALLGLVSVAATIPTSFRTRFWQLTVGGILIAFVTVGGFVLVSANPDPPTDVVYGHRAAADVLVRGLNPYVDAVFPDTAPAYANKGEIVGYSYPPASMVPYAIGEVAWDARLISVGSMAVVFVLILWYASAWSPFGLAILGIGLTYPMMGAIIIHGWTEPLQVALLALAAVAFSRWQVGGILIGLAAASKQYMILALVPLVAIADASRWQRLAVAVGTGLVVTAPFFLWNPGAFWFANVGVQFDRIQRLDTSSVAGFGLILPIGTAAVAGIVFAALAGVRARSTTGLLLAQAIGLATYFALSSNTFRNYWFLVAFITLLALSVPSVGSELSSRPLRRDHGSSHGLESTETPAAT